MGRLLFFSLLKKQLQKSFSHQTSLPLPESATGP